MPKEHAATLTLLLTPVQIIVPMVVTKYTASDRPFDLAIRSYLPRTLLAALSAFALVHFAPRETYAAMKEGEATWWDIWPYYAALLTVSLAYSVFAANMFVSQMAFFARVSDPAIGGTYMTLLNTVANLGYLGSKLVVTYGIDLFTFKNCYIEVDDDLVSLGVCTVPAGADVDPECAARDGVCQPWLDGYFVMATICLAVGVLWLVYFEDRLYRLQATRPDAWRVTTRSRNLGPLLVLLGLVGCMLIPSLARILG